MLHSFGGFFTNTMPCCRENAKRYTILSLSNQKSVPNVHHHDPLPALPVPNSKCDAMRTVDGRSPVPVIIRYHKLIWRTSHFFKKDFIGSRWWSSDFSPSTVGTYKMASPNLLSARRGEVDHTWLALVAFGTSLADDQLLQGSAISLSLDDDDDGFNHWIHLLKTMFFFIYIDIFRIHLFFFKLDHWNLHIQHAFLNKAPALIFKSCLL